MKRVVVFIVLVMLVIGSCAAQSATNEAQKLVGTWVVEAVPGAGRPGYSWTIVFNADGTGTLTDSSTQNIFWGVSTSGVLFITDFDEGTFYLSPDGRRMIWLNIVFRKR